MYTPHSNQIPEIAVYQTNGDCQILALSVLKAMAAQNNSDMRFQVTAVTPKKIRSGYLAQPHIVGLVMPGRNKASDYEAELGDDGMHKIHDQVHKGLYIHATCAGAAVFTKTRIWNNPFSPGDSKVTLSRWSLLNGIATGVINDLCRDPYLLVASPEEVDLNGDGRIPAEVVTVAYACPSSDQSEFAVIYNGGCDFIPHNKNDIDPLLYHQNTQHETYAAIGFSAGDGRCVFMNVHPELHYIQFSGAFGRTEKALRQPDLFKANVTSLKAGYYDHLGLFRDFAQDCLANGKMSHQSQPLITIAVNGLKPAFVHAESSALTCA